MQGSRNEDWIHPGVGPLTPEDEKTYHAYYLWVPYMLFFQVLLVAKPPEPKPPAPTANPPGRLLLCAPLDLEADRGWTPGEHCERAH